MVKRKSSLGRITANAKRTKVSRINESSDENVQRLESMRTNANQSRANESEVLRENRLQSLRNNARLLRSNQTSVDREVHLVVARNNAFSRRRSLWVDLKSAAFQYDSQMDFKCV